MTIVSMIVVVDALLSNGVGKLKTKALEETEATGAGLSPESMVVGTTEFVAKVLAFEGSIIGLDDSSVPVDDFDWLSNIFFLLLIFSGTFNDDGPALPANGTKLPSSQ
ncbi:unnamed protein product [[Candida] boidinii]|nr:unnamed protein product [[Candida] boidinii]